MILNWFKLFFLMTSSLFLISCSGGSSVAGGDNFPSVLPEDPTAGFDSNNFYIAVRNTSEVNSHFRTVGSFSSRCEVVEGASNQDLSCIVDIPEGDLYFHGLDLAYNIPPNMCQYVRRSTYWYYNSEVGFGPESVDITVNLDANDNITSSVCIIDGVNSCATASHLEATITTSGSNVTAGCVYDRTSLGQGNCCFGDYTLTKTITKPATATISETTEESWNVPTGGMKSCIGGAARTNWPDLGFTVEGYPGSITTFAGDGLAETYNLIAPITRPNEGTNFPIANFYTPASHTHVSFNTATVSTVPYFINPQTDRNGSGIISGNEAYTFICLNEAYEVRHRIRVYVREWDGFGDYLGYIATEGANPAYVPDRPTDLDTAPGCDGLIGLCNDLADSDDFARSLVDYTINPTNIYYDQAGEERFRIRNFPSEDYDN